MHCYRIALGSAREVTALADALEQGPLDADAQRYLEQLAAAHLEAP